MPPKRAKLVVLATGDLAIPVLDVLLDAGHEVSRIVASAPKGGEDEFQPEEGSGEALDGWAQSHKIEMNRRDRPGSGQLGEEFAALEPDLGLIVAYGRSFPASLLEIPKRGWIKVHFSLLPKYRGLHPIRAAIWHGENQAGATVIQVSDEPDAGPILEQESLDVASGETFGELAPRVADLGAQLAPQAVARVMRSKTPKVRKQNDKSASETPKFGRRHRSAAWWRAAGEISNRLRALSPEPGMTTLVKGERVQILEGSAADYIDSPIAESGSFIGLRSGRVAVLCGDGKVFAIRRVKRANGEVAEASAWARDKRLQVGDVLL